MRCRRVKAGCSIVAMFGVMAVPDWVLFPAEPPVLLAAVPGSVGPPGLTASALRSELLPPGFVQGDVVSHSYVPNRTWRPQEAIGILPYLFEYNLMRWTGREPLEFYHAENIRRIDIASQWSTAIQLYNRYDYFHDEIINLMIRCFRNRQLIILSARPNKNDPSKDSHLNLIAILETLWANRDRELVSPEGDRATGRQLINNILAASLGDEGECSLRTEGLRSLLADFDGDIRLREMDGQQPFRHIKAWYNMLAYVYGCHAASQEDADENGRFLIPDNTQAIGVDSYHYWFPQSSPFDPADLSVPRTQVRAHSDEWQRIRTRYYPQGVNVHACQNSGDPANWTPECWSDTHALMSAIQAAGAANAMMWYIGLSSQLGPGTEYGHYTYTTPIETMESYYDHLKAGPWSALSWWTFATDRDTHGGLEYYDKILLHYTPANPEGTAYSQTMLDYWHDSYVALKMRMFNDVVYNQFGYLHITPDIVEIMPYSGQASAGVEYRKQLILTDSRAQPMWSVVLGPPGLQVDGAGLIYGWVPGVEQIGQSYTVTIRAENPAGSDEESWQVPVLPEPSETIAAFSFGTGTEGWTLAGWRAGPYADGTMTWVSTGGRPWGNLRSTGSGATNNTDSCTREGGTATRSISTAGMYNLLLEYDVIASLNTPPGSGCTEQCSGSLVEGGCPDRLLVYCSTASPQGPWAAVHNLTEGIDLPAEWTRQVVSLANIPGASDNGSFALLFKWQFNTAADTGRIDNVKIKGSSMLANHAPQVNAGGDQTITLSSSVILDGTVVDDGLPDPPSLVAVTWNKISGPGTVSFGNANAVDTTASFSTVGSYVLRLTASDSMVASYDEVAITVTSDPPLPGRAASPHPADGATGVSTSAAELNWSAGSGATSHKVHFGTVSPPPYRATRTATTYDPGLLSGSTIFYWRIDEVGGAGTTTGHEWHFTTAAAPGDFDADGDVDQSDFGYLQECYSGSGLPRPSGCQEADFDGDGDVDQADFGVFSRCMRGAGAPPGC